jgi:sucrose phosphorylase
VLLAVIDVLFFLISKGASLLRLDAVTFLWKEPGTACANLVGTHALIKIMRSAVSALRDDVVAITETNVPHRENVAYFGNGHDEAHMVYNFALPPLIAHSLIQGDGRHLSQWAKGLTLPSDEVCFFNFSASHDGVGVRPVEEILNADELQQLVDATLAAKGKVSSRTTTDGKQRPYELNCTFLDLIAKVGEPESVTVSRFVAAQAIVLAMPGVPAIYIQSLLGTRNDFDLVAETGRARSINRSRHDYSTIESKLADKDGLEGKIFVALTQLIRVRRKHLAFNPYAKFQVLDLGDSVFALSRGGKADGQQVCSIINLAGQGVEVRISAEVAGIDLLTNKPIPAGKHTLPPYAVRWLSP